MITIKFSPRFPRALKKCSDETVQMFDECLAYFLNNPRDTRLHAKRLTGKLKGNCSFRVGKNYRVIYRQLSPDVYLFYDIDDRKDVYK